MIEIFKRGGQNGHKHRLRDHFVIYTSLFAITAACVFFPFLQNGKSFIWGNGKMGTDGLSQHYNAMVYFGIWARDIIKTFLFEHGSSIPLWDFNIGYGSDIITTLHYYVIGDPLDLLTIFVPSRYTEHLYDALVILRVYLAGVSFSLFCFRMKKNHMAVLAGSIAYAFCGYMIAMSVRHPFFCNPMIYLPLLLIGAEDIYHKKRPTLFIGMVFVSAVSNFYFFYMLVFAVVFYVVFRFFTLEHEHGWKRSLMYMLHFFLYGMIGVMLASFILLPIFLSLTGGMRGDMDIVYPAFYSVNYYATLITRFFVVKGPGEGTVFGFAPSVLLGLLVLFSQTKKRGILKIAFIVMAVMLCIPVMGKAMNGFSYVSNRWCFIFAALLCYVFVDVWPDMAALDKKQKIFIAVCSGIYCLILLALAQDLTEGSVVGMILLLVLAVAMLRGSRATPFLLLGAVVVHACVIGYFRNRDMSTIYLERGEALSSIKADATALVAEVMDRTSFARVDMSRRYLQNASAITRVPTTQFYWSMENGNVTRFLLDMCVGGLRMPFCYDGLEQRAALEALASVRYFVRSSAENGPVPYGFEEMGRGDKSKYTVFENRYALPLGYTYPGYLTHEDLDCLDPVRKQEALLQGILLEDKDIERLLGTADRISPVFTSQEIPYEIRCDDHVRRKGEGSYRSLKRGSSISLDISDVKDCELYLSIKGLRGRANTKKASHPIYNDIIHGRHDIGVEAGDRKIKLAYKTPSYRYYCGQKDFLCSLGYQKGPRRKITVTFPYRGRYHMDDVKVICQPMEHYAKQVDALKENVLEEEEIGGDRIKGSITLDRDKILCLTVPYHKGWRAYVDGVEKPIYKGNGMYMALPLTAGKHEILLEYRTYGLKAGACISGIGFLIFFAVCIRKRKERRHP